MALKGDCTYIEQINHETETTTETITFPNGDTETVERPVQIEETTNYNDVYLCITQVENFNYFSDSIKQVLYHYAAYSNVESRNADQQDFLFSGNGVLENYDHEGNLYAQIYSDIKTIDGLTDLTDN